MPWVLAKSVSEHLYQTLRHIGVTEKNKMKSHFAVFCIVRAEIVSIWMGSSNVRVCRRLGSIYFEAKILPVRAMKIYRVSHELRSLLRESVPYVKIYRYNPKHLCPKLNGFRDNGKRSFKLWQLLHTYWLPNSYWNWQEYVVSVMLISVLNM